MARSLKLTNSFHNTEATVRGYESAEALLDDYLGAMSRSGSARETGDDSRLIARVKRIRRTLCPSTGCTCGDTLGRRG